MDKTIAAISSGLSESGIGVIRMSGEKAFDIGHKIFKSFSGKKAENRYMTYGHVYDGSELIDEVMITFLEEPNTYTKEDIVEIYSHGSILSMKKILNLMVKEGASLAERGEFTKRAFLNGRLDLSQAESVMDLISAKTEESYKQSLYQLKGGMRDRIEGLRKSLKEVLIEMEVSINFSEDDEMDFDTSNVYKKTKDISEDIGKILTTSNKGKLLREGINIAIIGKPNVGKSSLLNVLIDENRAIVTDIPGTTRDVIEESLEIKGIKINLIDTAGIRETEDTVEQIGVERSLVHADTADLLIGIFDISKDLDGEDEKILDILKGKKSIVLLNKTDLGAKISKEKISKVLPGKIIIESSIGKKEGIESLENAIVELFDQGDIQEDSELIVSNLRQENLLRKAKESLDLAISDFDFGVPIDCIEVYVRSSWEDLGQILGYGSDMEEVLDSIFSEFCIGK